MPFVKIPAATVKMAGIKPLQATCFQSLCPAPDLCESSTALFSSPSSVNLLETKKKDNKTSPALNEGAKVAQPMKAAATAPDAESEPFR